MTSKDDDFDINIAKEFFAHHYHDRGLLKWRGFFLSDHTSALKKQTDELNEIYEPLPQQSDEEIAELLGSAYNNKRPVTIQLNIFDANGINVPDIDGLIGGYEAGNVYVGSQSVDITDIRHVEVHDLNTR